MWRLFFRKPPRCIGGVFIVKKIFPILVILLGFYWIAGAFEYGLWVRKGPGGGFMPLVAGIAAILFAIWTMILQRNETVSPELASWHALLPIVALVGVVLFSYIIGLILSVAVFIILWLKVVERHHAKFSVLTGLVSAGIFYAVFGVWLQVPFPLGLFEYLF